MNIVDKSVYEIDGHIQNDPRLVKRLYDTGDNRQRYEDGEPLTKEESLWVWSILITFTIAPAVVIALVARHL
jgi:hypothetical protein